MFKRYFGTNKWHSWTFAALYEESQEFEVAEVCLNVPWAQQAEKKSLDPGCQKKNLSIEENSYFEFFGNTSEF